MWPPPFVFLDATCDGMQPWAQSFGEGATEVVQAALAAVRALGLEVTEVTLADLPYDALMSTLLAEAAAVFEPLTLENIDDTLTWQDETASPNTMRKARFLSAVYHVQLDRLPYQVMLALGAIFKQCEVMIGPYSTGPMLVASNFTSHACLHLRAGFIEAGTRDRGVLSAGKLKLGGEDDTGQRFVAPQGISLWERLFDEGPMLILGLALERVLGVAAQRPSFPA